MGLEILLLAVGLAFLMGGGEGVVRGATRLARALGVSPLMIGLTVVAFGTSAPEMAVNVIAVMAGQGAISFGNIIGSNMANIGLIVGCTALIRPIVVTGVVIAREIPMMLLATAAAVVMGFDAVLGEPPDVYDRADGLLLLMLFGVFLYYTVGDFVKRRAGSDGNGGLAALEQAGDETIGKSLVITLVGLAALIGGARVTVDAAVEIARGAGVPEEVIGLTLVAVGTSLPELVASLVATLRGYPELAMGNVIGSNIFNLLFVMGATALIGQIPVPPEGHLDLALMGVLSLSLFLVATLGSRQILRTEALLLLLSYAGYVSWRSAQAFGG